MAHEHDDQSRMDRAKEAIGKSRDRLAVKSAGFMGAASAAGIGAEVIAGNPKAGLVGAVAAAVGKKVSERETRTFLKNYKESGNDKDCTHVGRLEAEREAAKGEDKGQSR